jgi:hypothetical protein
VTARSLKIECDVDHVLREGGEGGMGSSGVVHLRPSSGLILSLSLSLTLSLSLSLTLTKA